MLTALKRLLEAEKDLHRSKPIGTIIHYSPGGILYMSSEGVKTLDDAKDLEEARREDETVE